MARMAGVEPANLRFLQKAVEEGLGDIETSAIELEGKLTVIPDFKLPPLSGNAHFASPRMVEIIQNRVGLRPHTDETLCTACETCVEQCPVSALSMKENLPEVDPNKCIICFCCQEICPEKAIALK
jgi:ferredoxin